MKVKIQDFALSKTMVTSSLWWRQSRDIGIICPIIGIGTVKHCLAVVATQFQLIRRRLRLLSTPIVSTSSVEDASRALPPFQWSAQDPRARKSRRCRRSNYQIVRHFTRVKREPPEAAGERGKGIRCEGESPTKKRGVLRGVRSVKMKLRWNGNREMRYNGKEKEKKIRFLEYIFFFLFFFNPLICVYFLI